MKFPEKNSKSSEKIPYTGIEPGTSHTPILGSNYYAPEPC
jgi:hypothetical protein